ncbi:hypothetical protein [Nocardioides luteus]|uniref:hypothetical protein n=1 Tax=Nocardioides luteus TaxID=1844 RepID=UPI0018CA1406|nr:hypothetical protein [Nocardioides luteus]MBG6099197.1 hypothetical protein [Nocardioides luteus]
MTMSRASAMAALILSVALAGAGCTSSGGGTSPGTDEPKPTPSASPSESSVPADWKVAAIEEAQVQIPPDWTTEQAGKWTVSLVAPKDDLGSSAGFGTFLSGALGPGDLEKAAGYEKDILVEDGAENLKRLPDVTVNGSVFYHFQYETGRTWNDSYGTKDGEKLIEINWDLSKTSLDRSEADALIAKVLPTFKLL